MQIPGHQHQALQSHGTCYQTRHDREEVTLGLAHLLMAISDEHIAIPFRIGDRTTDSQTRIVEVIEILSSINSIFGCKSIKNL